jgi:hypothetical protein
MSRIVYDLQYLTTRLDLQPSSLSFQPFLCETAKDLRSTFVPR